MKQLDAAALKKDLAHFCSPAEIQGLSARRDLMVKFFDGKGDSARFDRPQTRTRSVFYYRPPALEPHGAAAN